MQNNLPPASVVVDNVDEDSDSDDDGASAIADDSDSDYDDTPLVSKV
jgi:hypothetical protein